MDIRKPGTRKDYKNHALRGMLLTMLVFFALGCTGSFAYTPGDPEYRAFWVDAWHAGAWTQAQIDTLLGVVGDPASLGVLRTANCNAVVIQVRRNCDVNYPSGMDEPYMTGLSPADFNGLQAAINAAHDTTGGKKRIEVYAGIVTFRTSGGHVYGEHDDTPTGSLTNLDNFWPSLTDTGALVADKAFDPGHPLVEQYTVDVAMDIVNNFDIDGIQYDYIRFTGENQGYNPTSIARYNARYGLTGVPSPADEQFKQWRRDQVTAFVRKMYAKIQAVKPWVKQSAAVVTGSPGPPSSTREGFQATRPYYETYADWDAWLEEGILDAAFPMTYYDYGSNPGDYTAWMNFEKDRHHGRHIVIGGGLYLNSLSNSLATLAATRDPSPSGNYADGFCGYSYFAPFTNGGTAYGAWADFSPSFASSITSTWADVPPMLWKETPLKGHISGTVRYSDGVWVDGALVTLVGPENRTQYCDGTGFYAFINLEPGTYTVTASKAGCADAQATVTVAVGEVTGDMYVTDLQLLLPPPVISDVAATDLTATSATITWTTNQASNSMVEYGATTDYGSSSPLDNTPVTSHSITITGLTQGTTYHFRVMSANGNGDSTSEDYTFATTNLLQITDVQATPAGGLATISWNTSQASSSKVEYGLTSDYGLSTAVDNSEVFAHSMTLSNLSPNTTYHYRVISGNDNGTVPSADEVFTTASFAYISDVRAENITNAAAVIAWTTDVGATSQVEYGVTTDYGSSTALDTNEVTTHSVELSGLAANTVYNYRVKSTCAVGTSTTANYTFKTDGPPSISNIQVTPTFCGATITWTTDNNSDSTVNYGATAAYGSVQTDAGLTKSHSITFSGLLPATQYHYKCVSANPYGSGESADATFTTASQVPDVVVDNTDPGWANTSPNGNLWTSGSMASVIKVGASYLYCKGDGSTVESGVTRKCTWTPTLMVPGQYDVWVFYQTGTNRSTAAPFTIHHRGSAQTYLRNQNGNSNLSGWYKLASGVTFDAGTAGYVEATTLSTDGVGLVSADAAKWVYVGPPDNDAPTVSIGAPSVTAANVGPVTFTVSYSGADTVSLNDSDVTLNKTGTADGTVSVSGTGTATRTVTISSITGDGTLGISIASGSASDMAGNTAAEAGPSATFSVDNTVPTVSIGAPSAASATAGPVDYVVSYDGADSVTLSAADVTLVKTGTANGTVTVTGEGTATRTVSISSLAGEGTLGISIAAGTASDTLGNAAAAAGPSDTFSVDNEAPAIEISAPSATTTKAGPIEYTVSYTGADAVTLTEADVTLVKTGTADGNVAVTGEGTTTRTVTISGISGDGTLAISIGAGTAVDASANLSAAAGPSTAVTVDNTAPNVSIGPPSAAATAVGPVAFTVSYGGADAVTLTEADVTLVKTGTANGSIAVSGEGVLSRTVTVSGITGEGTLGISVAGGTASDNAGNVAASAEPSATFTVDRTAPTITIGAPSLTATKVGPVRYTITYAGATSVSLPVTKVTLNKTGTANGVVSVSSAGALGRVVTISSITGNGTLGITIAAGTAIDAARNAAPAKTSTTFVVDSIAPTIAVSAPSLASTRTTPVRYTVTYGGASSITLTTAKIVLTKTGTANAVMTVSGSGTTSRIVTLSSLTGSGTLAITVAAGTAMDAARNLAPASLKSRALIVDNSAPVMTKVTGETYTASTTSLKASWAGSDPNSGIVRYEYAVGTVARGSNVKTWTSAGTNLSATITGLVLRVGVTYYVSVRAVNGVGLVSPPLSSAGILIARSVTSIQGAKSLPNGTAVALPARVVSGVCPTAFYIEESSRLSGIRVELAKTLTPGQSVKVLGKMGVAANGEQAILAPIVPDAPVAGVAVTPVVVTLRTVGGATQGNTPGPTFGTGTNNTGLLVKVTGKVTSVVADGFYIDDGSRLTDGTGNIGLKIWTGAANSALRGASLTTSGIVSLRKSGTALYPVLLRQTYYR